MTHGPLLNDNHLYMASQTVDDLERVRIASENRLRQMTRAETDKDGAERGLGLPDYHPDVEAQTAVVNGLKQLEHQAVLHLNRLVRKHPLWTTFQDQRGVGEKQFGRLLGVIGDPYWKRTAAKNGGAEEDRPRTVGELKAYCGLHVIGGAGTPGVAPARQRKVKSNWNTAARKRLWLIACAIITANMGKNANKPGRSKYAKVYEAARFEQYGDAVHELPCIRCGPSGKPAPAGTPLSDGHKHARAIRKVMDAILHDLYYTAKQHHEDVEQTR